LLKANLSDGNVTKIGSASTNMWYSGGRLLTTTAKTLVAVPVKGSSLERAGDPQTVAENINVDTDRWAADFTVSDNGLLVYRTSGASDNVQLSWIDVETGKILGSVGEPGAYSNLALSPDASKVAMLVKNPRSEYATLSVMDVARGLVSPLLPMYNRTRVNGFVWTPDSKSLVFVANIAGPNRYDLFIKPVDGSEPEKPLLQVDGDAFPNAVSRDGRFVLFTKYNGKARNDVWMLPLGGDRKPVPLIASPASEQGVEISADGKWMLYSSDEIGHPELYITTFPIPHGRWQVSTNGTAGGTFESGGKRIANVGSDGKIYVIPFDGKGPEPKFGQPLVSLGGAIFTKFNGGSITPDWKHFIVGVNIRTTEPKITLMTNWTEDLKK